GAGQGGGSGTFYGGGRGGAAAPALPPPTKEEAIAAFTAANPNWQVFNTQNPNELVAQDGEGHVGVYRYDPRSGQLTLVGQTLDINSRRTDNIDTLAPQEAAALVAQGQNA